MAQSSSSYDSHLNLTSGLLSQLDLNPSQNQNMEDMDIDQVIDVPDTPDRLAARNTNGDERVESESKTSVGGDSGNSNFLDVGVINRTRGRSGLISQNGHYKGLYFRSNKNFNDLEATEHRIHQSESLSAPRDTHINRRIIPDKTSKNVTKHSIGDQHMDKGKGLCNKSPMKLSTFQEGNADIDSKEQNGYTRILCKDFPHRVFKNPLAEEITEGSISRNGLHCMPNSVNPTVTYHKGKEVAGDDRGGGSVFDHGKAVNSTSEFQPKIGKSVTSPLHSSTSPRVFGNKRLVRNGCISPHNIAKASAGQSSGGSKDAEHNDTGNLVPSSPSCLLDIRDLSAEGNNHSKAKGKGRIVHSCIARETDARTEHFFNSSVVHNEEANGVSDVNENASGSFEGLGGWRSTRNRSKKEYPPFSDEGVGLNLQREKRVDRRVYRSGDYSRTQYDNPEVQDTNSSQHGSAPPLAQTAASLVSESDLANGRRHRVTNTLIKRQKKHGSNLTNHGAYSASHFNDSEIMFLGSSGESSNSRLTRNRSRHGRSLLDPVIEIDELSPKVGPSGSQHMGPRTNDDDSNTRARQVEADEILARELQEQLYQEGPTSRGDEQFDAHLAWTLQQEGSPNASSTGSHHALHPSASSISALYRRSRSRSLQNPSSRRGLQARVSNSARMAQLRSHFHNQPLSILPRERNLFPSDMDLDMRLDILEALEAAVGGLSDMRRGQHINQFQRDFNENDYEMLLSLDENNHQHGGASVDQINRLPQSTVQTDNFEEACAICLETPTSGDTIRHLPCLHKFHKDCIDPWLRRKTSCPICKSSIT